MFFVIEQTIPNIQYNKAVIKHVAASKLAQGELSGKDKLLDDYLKNKYKVGLKLICLNLVQRCKIQFSQEKEFIITFPEKNDDKFARLITYGNGVIQGSNILKIAFKQ